MSRKRKVMNYKRSEGNDMFIKEESLPPERFEVVPPGVYKPHNVGMIAPQLGLEPYEMLNELTTLSESPVMQKFIDDVDIFLSDDVKSRYKELGMNHQVGYILYGKPGTGKTSLAILIMDELAKKYGAIALDGTAHTIQHALWAINEIREIQDNPIILFMDEIDRHIKRNEDGYLRFLDGTDSVPNLIFIGCTNFLDEIPFRISNRRSRIKECIEIRTLPLEVYHQFAEPRLASRGQLFIDDLCHKAMKKELTIDQFKNVILDIHVFGKNINEAIKDSMKLFADGVEPNEEEDDDDDSPLSAILRSPIRIGISKP